jgi:trans-aconitate 2-methyltransferase
MRKILVFVSSFLFLCTSATTQPPPKIFLMQWDADEYAKNGILQFKWAAKFFLNRYQWKGTEYILDVGSGDGKITHLLSKYASQGAVVGLDNSPTMLEYARKTYQNDLNQNLTFIFGDASQYDTYKKLPQQFDLVVSFHTLHWFEDQTQALLGVMSVLKPNGRAFLRLTSNGWDPVQEIADRLAASEKWRELFVGFKDPVSRFSVEQYTTLVKNAGFIPIRIEEAIENDTIANPELLFKQIKSWLPHARYLPVEYQKSYLDDVVSAYLTEVPLDPDGSIHLYDCYVEVEVKRPESPFALLSL